MKENATTIRLERIDSDNWVEVLELRVAPEQERFVASNAESLAQAGIYSDLLTACAIYADEAMVGFMLFGWDEEDVGRSAIIHRLMIDQRFQGMGYGRAAMIEVLRRLREKPGCDTIYLSFKPDNLAACKLYASLGFVDDGRIVDGEVVYRLDVVKE